MPDTGSEERWLRLDRDRGRINELALDCSRMVADGVEMEEILAFLRREGCTKCMTIFILREVTGMTTADGKDLVDHSQTWHDVYARDREFHEMLEEAVTLLQAEGE